MRSVSNNMIEAMRFEAESHGELAESRTIREALEWRNENNHFVQGIMNAIDARRTEGV